MGPDYIPSKLVKDCKSDLISPSRHVFNLILKIDIFPKAWKKSKIVAIHKSGSQSEVTNYRPIAQITVFSKIFEIILADVIYWHVTA